MQAQDRATTPISPHQAINVGKTAALRGVFELFRDKLVGGDGG